jgi:hypothetical protein
MISASQSFSSFIRRPSGVKLKTPIEMEQVERRSVPSPLVGEGQGGRDSLQTGADPSPLPYRLFCDIGREGSDPFGLPPTPSPSPQGGGESRRSCGERSIHPDILRGRMRSRV